MSHGRVIEVETFLPHPPSKVWRAMTDPERLGRWLMPGDLRPVAGHRFTFDVPGRGVTACEILEVDPERLLRMSWRNGPLDTIVSWSLTPEGTGTRLTIVHSGFDPNDRQQRQALDAMADGWGGTIVARLRDMLGARSQDAPGNDASAFAAASRSAMERPSASR
jgi:uncharacterized protein YndB with AHSA1/START domain